ncbi:hypothetical protein TrRE_jg7870 [Triparma retinervis]|uniref:Uncharacterized protein n=1 Tax=Triparma retinervis TaxID=2557542 RepID=A0A9W7DRB0_9STRA|nr:hypothetical protein TrRE_jg7870 [Triparma retinervis]
MPTVRSPLSPRNCSARREIALAKEVRSPNPKQKKKVKPKRRLDSENFDPMADPTLPATMKVSGKKSKKNSGLTKSLSRLTSSPLRTSRSFAKTVGKAAAKAGKIMGRNHADDASAAPAEEADGQGKPSVPTRSSTKNKHRPTLSSAAGSEVFDARLMEDFAFDSAVGGGDTLEAEVLAIMAQKKQKELKMQEEVKMKVVKEKEKEEEEEIVEEEEEEEKEKVVEETKVEPVVEEPIVTETKPIVAEEEPAEDVEDEFSSIEVVAGSELGDDVIVATIVDRKVTNATMSADKLDLVVDDMEVDEDADATPLNAPSPRRTSTPKRISASLKTAPSPWTEDANKLIKGEAKISVSEKVAKFQDEQKRLKEAEKKCGKVVESPWTKDAQDLISQHATQRVKKEKLVMEQKVVLEEERQAEERARSPKKTNDKVASFPDNKQDDSPGEDTCIASLGAAVTGLGNGAMERLRSLGSILAKTKDGAEEMEKGEKEEQNLDSTNIKTAPNASIVSEDALIADVKPSPSPTASPSLPPAPAPAPTSDIDVDALLEGASPAPPAVPSTIPSVLSSASLSSVRSSSKSAAPGNRRSNSPLRSTGRSTYNQTPIKSHKRGASGSSEINHPYSAKMRRSEC